MMSDVGVSAFVHCCGDRSDQVIAPQCNSISQHCLLKCINYVIQLFSLEEAPFLTIHLPKETETAVVRVEFTLNSSLQGTRIPSLYNREGLSTAPPFLFCKHGCIVNSQQAPR